MIAAKAKPNKGRKVEGKAELEAENDEEANGARSGSVKRSK